MEFNERRKPVSSCLYDIQTAWDRACDKCKAKFLTENCSTGKADYLRNIRDWVERNLLHAQLTPEVIEALDKTKETE